MHGKKILKTSQLISTENARSKLFIRLQTYGIKITVRSTVEAVKVLLQNGCKFLLIERFCQDSVEDFLGIQRQLGRRNGNPDMAKLGYKDNIIRIQRDVSFTFGSMKERYNKKTSSIEVSAESVPKQKSKKCELNNIQIFLLRGHPFMTSTKRGETTRVKKLRPLLQIVLEGRDS